MSKKKIVAPEIIDAILAAFPEVFKQKGPDIRPLKVDIHLDLHDRLPSGISRNALSSFLSWYVHRPAYIKALARGETRIDAWGRPVEGEAGQIPQVIRDRAQKRLDRASVPRETGSADANAAVHSTLADLNLEELFAMATPAKMEVKLKFTCLPGVQPFGQGQVAFVLLLDDGQKVLVAAKAKSWRKVEEAVKAAQDKGVSWVGEVSGTIAERTTDGFRMDGPGLKVYEKQKKETPEQGPAQAVAPAEPKKPVSAPTSGRQKLTLKEKK